VSPLFNRARRGCAVTSWRSRPSCTEADIPFYRRELYTLGRDSEHHTSQAWRLVKRDEPGRETCRKCTEAAVMLVLKGPIPASTSRPRLSEDATTAISVALPQFLTRQCGPRGDVCVPPKGGHFRTVPCGSFRLENMGWSSSSRRKWSSFLGTHEKRAVRSPLWTSR
jgi:hypothetical protein